MPGRTVASKLLAILGAFEDGPPTRTLTELAAAADVPMPTAHRLAGELVAWGALRKDPGGRYRVGRRIWKIGQNAGRELRDSAHRHLGDLFARTGEACQLAIRDGDQALVIERADAGADAIPGARPGDRLPLHVTAVGLVLLAHEPPWIRDAYVARVLRRSPAERRRLADELLAIREQGVAATEREAPAGASLAVPVLADGEHAVAAVGLVLAAADRRRRDRHLAELRRAARRIEPEAQLWPNTPAILAAFS